MKLIKTRPEEDSTIWNCGFPVHRYLSSHVLLWICPYPWIDIEVVCQPSVKILIWNLSKSEDLLTKCLKSIIF